MDLSFYTDIFDVFSVKRFKKFILAFFIPWYFIGQADGNLNKSKPWCTWFTMAITFYAWIGLMIAEAGHHGLAYLAWPCYIGFAIYGCGTRSAIREHFKIEEGNIFEDFFAVLLIYPLAAVQMDAHMENALEEDYKKKKDDYNSSKVGFTGNKAGLYPMANINIKENSDYYAEVDRGAVNPAQVNYYSSIDFATKF